MIAVERLRAAPLFANTRDEVLRPLAGACTELRIRVGRRLWLAGTQADHVFLIERGLVQVVRDTPSGAIELIGLCGPPDVVALSAALHAGVYPASGVAAATVDIVRVPTPAFREALALDPKLSSAVVDALLAHTEQLRAKIFIASAGSIGARVAALLLHLAERFAERRDATRTSVPVAVSRAAMAGMVSARPETVSRVLGQMRADGVVETRDEGLSIDEAALRKIVAAG